MSNLDSVRSNLSPLPGTFVIVSLPIFLIGVCWKGCMPRPRTGIYSFTAIGVGNDLGYKTDFEPSYSGLTIYRSYLACVVLRLTINSATCQEALANSARSCLLLVGLRIPDSWICFVLRRVRLVQEVVRQEELSHFQITECEVVDEHGIRADLRWVE